MEKGDLKRPRTEKDSNITSCCSILLIYNFMVANGKSWGLFLTLSVWWLFMVIISIGVFRTNQES